jgi:hypothetical protein
MSNGAQIDFSSVGAIPVQPTHSQPKPIDFSSVGGKPVQSTGDQTPNSSPASQGSSLGDKVKALGQEFWNTLPPGILGNGAAAVEDWARSQEPILNPKSAPSSPTLSALRQFTTGSLADAAGDVKTAASPTGLATTAATIAAPEIMGPALMAHGGYSAVTGWGDLSNPDVLQNELNSGAEIAGGAAVTGATIQAGGGPITQAARQKLNPAPTPARAAQDLQTAIPPSKSAPYADIDMQKVRPYLEAEHGSTPIDTVAGLRDAADSAIGKIEDRVEQAVTAYDNRPINRGTTVQYGNKTLYTAPGAKSVPNALADVRQQLAGSPRGQAFVDAGTKDLEDFHLDQAKTLSEMDDIRRQLNLENQGVLAKNNYKVAVARAADPGFAARETAAESLRNQIYDALQNSGIPGAQGIRALRLDEGSLIKIRNAAQEQIFNGEKAVRSTAQSGPAARVGKAVVKSGATALGAAKGGWPGAIVGREVGEALGNAVTPEALTRNELIERSFAKPVATAVPAKATPAAVSLPAAAAVSSTAAQPRLSDMIGGLAPAPSY